MRYNFTVVKFKKILHVMIFLSILVLLFMLSENNALAIKSSLNTFQNLVFPALFPFIFFTEFISNTNILDILCDKTKNIIYKIFPISAFATSPIIIGFLCGFPTGAKIIRKLYNDKKINFSQAEVLLSFTNNCNPIFIYATIGILIFNNSNIGIILLLSHVLASVVIGILYSHHYTNNIIHENSNILNRNHKKILNTKENISLFKNVKQSLFNSFIDLLNIFGFILFFNLIYTNFEIILNKLSIDKNIITIINPLLEITTGIEKLHLNLSLDIESKILLTSFLLGFSGLCIIFQIYSVIYDAGFSFKKLLIVKILHGIISYIITLIILLINKYFNILQIYNSNTVFNSSDIVNFYNTVSVYKYLYIALACISLIIFLIVKQKKIAK